MILNAPHASLAFFIDDDDVSLRKESTNALPGDDVQEERTPSY